MSSYTVFNGFECIGRGSLKEVAEIVKGTDTGQTGNGVLVFYDLTGVQTDICPDAAVQVSKGKGRPKLGVVPREVTLLPRHWEWLNAQPGGASVALRRLVEEARRNPKEERRAAKDAIYKFMSALCGDLEGYEEAVRALYADEGRKFFEYVWRWPKDVSEYIERMSEVGFDE